jgi:hypothetical protein
MFSVLHPLFPRPARLCLSGSQALRTLGLSMALTRAEALKNAIQLRAAVFSGQATADIMLDLLLPALTSSEVAVMRCVCMTGSVCVPTWKPREWETTGLSGGGFGGWLGWEASILRSAREYMVIWSWQIDNSNNSTPGRVRCDYQQGRIALSWVEWSWVELSHWEPCLWDSPHNRGNDRIRVNTKYLPESSPSVQTQVP